jgi:hypothetical protein
MIVKPHPEGWEVIFQRSHGVLAAQIAFHWQKSQRPRRWIETMLATAEHDDAQEDFSGKKHITESGSPMDFKMQELYIHQPQLNAKYALQKSRWMGLLNSQHITFLWEEKRGKEAALDKLLDEQQVLQKKLIKDLKITAKEAQQAYHILEWCDALSLLLCQDLVQPEERKMEISTAPDGTIHQLWQRKADGTLVVEPWCFEEENFEVAIDVRLVKQLVFKNDAELEKALQKATIIEKSWQFKK